MKKIISLLAVMASLVVLSSAAFAANGNHVARFNHKTGLTLDRNGVEALYRTAQVEPALTLLLQQDFGLDFSSNLVIRRHWNVPVGQDFVNTGEDVNGLPCHWQDKSQGFECYEIQSKTTLKVAYYKGNCLNGVNRRQGVPGTGEHLEESSTANFNLNQSNSIWLFDFHPTFNTNATATASTGAINITINNTQAAAPLMAMGGGGPNQYYVKQDSNGMFSFGWTPGGGTKINVKTTNVNVNDINVKNVNNNDNNNSNVNGNTNTVKVDK